MKRLWAIAVIVLLAASVASAAEQSVTFKSGSETGQGVLVTPEGKGPFPAVIVIQEWWGLNDWVKQQAQALAKQGYVTLAVDLYRGKSTDKQEEAHQLMMGLSQDSATRDLQGAYTFLQSRADVTKGPHVADIEVTLLPHQQYSVEEDRLLVACLRVPHGTKVRPSLLTGRFHSPASRLKQCMKFE